MKSILNASLAALAGTLMLAGCAVAPVGGPYAYGYQQPYYYYDSGPAYYGYYGYYDYGPHYYYGRPAIAGSFRFSDRDHHSSQGGAWRHNALTSSSVQTSPRVSRTTRSTAPTRHQASRAARPNRVVVQHDAGSHG
ncbi:MAG TPA: hypothetical protein VGK37_01475 [Casimicrobiaceae bacterium]|jgi:hypothetical protein